LEKLAFHVYLYDRQNRYRDIMRLGRSLIDSFVVVPDEEQGEYVKVLRLIGDSYQRVGHVYDATEFYERALMVDPDNLETLVSLRRNFERLNDEDEVGRIAERIESLMTHGDRDMGGVQILKGRTYTAKLILDGRERRLILRFGDGGEEEAVERNLADVREGEGDAERPGVAEGEEEGAGVREDEEEGERATEGDVGREGQIRPLISVVFNGRIVWEDFVEGGRVSVLVQSEEGENQLVLSPVNRNVLLDRISYE